MLIIRVLLSMVIRPLLFVTMEGTLMGRLPWSWSVSGTDALIPSR